MPTGVHDCHQHWVKNEMLDWVAANSLTFDELKYLEVAVGTSKQYSLLLLSMLFFFCFAHLEIAFRNFQVPYTSSSKEPDLSIRSDAQELPQIVFESGWAEFWPRLHQGMQLWLTGGQPMVHLVILLKWSQLSRNRVTGVVEVFDRDTAGSPRPRQTEVTFYSSWNPSPSECRN